MKTRAFLLLAVVSLACLPQPALGEDNSAGNIEPDVVYGHKHGLAMTMDVYRPASEANEAAVLFMVSGGWYSRWSPPESARPLFQPFLDKGYTVFAVRHGSSPRYTLPEAVADVRRAVRFVRKNAEQFGIDPQRLGVLGMSAGGHLALVLGTTGDDGNSSGADELENESSRVAAVVALVPPTDLRVMVWDAPESLPAYRNFPALDLPMDEAEKHSPLVHVSEDDAPALVLMGGADELVPAKHGEWIAEAFEEKGVDHKLIVYPDLGHNLLVGDYRQKIVDEITGWFDQHLTDNRQQE